MLKLHRKKKKKIEFSDGSQISYLSNNWDSHPVLVDKVTEIRN